MNLLVVPQILTWTAILALQSASASSLRSNCSKKLSVEQLRCFLGEDASFWQDQSHHILSLLTLTKDILVNICEMLWEQLQDKLVFIAGVLLTVFLLGYLLHRCCSHADGYRTLMNVQDELGIDELFKVRLRILQGAIFMAIDVTLDNVNGIIYCWRGLKVFGPLTLAIPVVSGFCCFVYKRNSWALAPRGHTDAAGERTYFYSHQRDRNGQLKPGLEECNPSDAAGGGFPYSLCGLQRAREVWAGVEGRNCFQWCCGRLPIGFASNVHSVLHGTFKLPPRSLQHLYQHCVPSSFLLTVLVRPWTWSLWNFFHRQR